MDPPKKDTTKKEVHVTFVTAYYSISSSSNSERTLEWRLKHFRDLLSTGLSVMLFTDSAEPFQDLLQEFPHFQIGDVLPLTETTLYQKHIKAIVNQHQMPEYRNKEKDTFDYLFLMLLKNEFLQRAMDKGNSTHYAWIDFSISYIFKKTVSTFDFLRFICSRPLGRFLIMPGSWATDRNTNFINLYGDNVIQIVPVWRFCGGFFMGDRESIQAFNQVYCEQFSHLLSENKNTMIWEMNYWAWLEYKQLIHPLWYFADHHDDMLLNIPENIYIHPLSLSQQIVYSYPVLESLDSVDSSASSIDASLESKWLPGSASHMLLEGRHWLNTRYINYQLGPQGQYFFQDADGIIRTENVLCELKPDETGALRAIESSFRRIKDLSIFPIRHLSTMSEGWEDIRLFATSEGKGRFVATNVNRNIRNIPQIAVGDYCVQTAIISHVDIMDSPHYEKNWIPWNDQEYIYKWKTEGVVFRSWKTDPMCERLVPYPKTNALLAKARGSSVFVDYLTRPNKKYKIGVVHYSREGSPRQYVHFLVVLNAEDGRVVQHSQPFYFRHLSVEFCTGFYMGPNSLFHFWISQMDREPLYCVAEESAFTWYEVMDVGRN